MFLPVETVLILAAVLVVVLRVEMVYVVVPLVAFKVVLCVVEAKAKAEESTAFSTLLVMKLDLWAEEDLVSVDCVVWAWGG
jgi:hypothetical protein